MDPKGDMGIDYTCGIKYNNMWQLYCKVWNREHQNLLPVVTKTLPHDMQPLDDSNNCGIYTLMASISFLYFLRELPLLQKLKKVGMTTFLYLQFAQKYLMGEDITLIDPDTDGPTIAAEIMEASTLSNECITCGHLCTKYRTDDNFKCQLCDPSRREEDCFNCGGKPDGTILNCKDMCEAFVNAHCLPLGMKSYRCGICMV